MVYGLTYSIQLLANSPCTLDTKDARSQYFFGLLSIPEFSAYLHRFGRGVGVLIQVLMQCRVASNSSVAEASFKKTHLPVCLPSTRTTGVEHHAQPNSTFLPRPEKILPLLLCLP